VLTIEDLRKQFEKQQIKEYNLSYSWLKRYKTGNYKSEEMENDWKAYQLCARVNKILKEEE
jgi:hypothetical protein